MKSKKLYSPVIAAHRFGLGARPGEVQGIGDNARNWLLGQLRKNSYPQEFKTLSPTSELLKRANAEMKKRAKQRKSGKREPSQEDRDRMRQMRRTIRQDFAEEMLLRMQVATSSEQPFVERLVRFWSNHFTVSIKKNQVTPLVGAFEREAIRPHINGKFEDMLMAVAKHPAMLIYLDNHRSIGPESKIGARRDKGLNENLAREILELHTLGVNGGYKQKDVEALANIITGWTVPLGPLANRHARKLSTAATKHGFIFVDRMHQPGTKVLLGRRYSENGVKEGEEALRRLARHPATAKHIAFKLAQHFISDEPPKAAVDYLAKVFESYGGDLERLAKALVELEDCWSGFQSKVKNPEELLISCLRVGNPRIPERFYRHAFDALGQIPFAAPSPAGWSDTAEEWISPDAMVGRMELVRTLAYRMPRSLDARKLAEETYEDLLSDNTKLQLKRAPSSRVALALFFASPEFQRR